MHFILNLNEAAQQIISDYIAELSKKSKEELVALYNRENKIGIVGVNRQALYLYSLGKVFKRQFGKSPISIENEVILSLTGKIRLEGNNYIYAGSGEE